MKGRLKMIDVFITYDRYEHNEWFYVYRICLDEGEAYNSCIETDLPDFISYGPDDCHSFQLQKVSMTKKDYNKLKKLIAADENGECACKEFDEIMKKIYEGDYETETILQTDGQSDFFEVLHEYCGEEPERDDYDDDESYEEAYAEYENNRDELISDDEKFTEALKNHINCCY